MPLPWRDDRHSRREPAFTRPLNSGAERFGPTLERLYPSMYSSQYDVKVGRVDMSLPAAFANYVQREFRSDPDCQEEFLSGTSQWLAKVGGKA